MTLFDEAVLLIIGFVLTTVLGGVLGTLFQRRAWNHQFRMAQYQAERSSAESALHEISSILDKRHYRMLLLFWHLNDDEKEVNRCLTEYRAVLMDWNDGLNRRLAIVATHFGEKLRQDLETMYESYTRTGSLLEEAVAGRLSGKPSAIDGIEEGLASLDSDNYSFTEKGLGQIIEGRIGSRLSAPVTARPYRRRGHPAPRSMT
jgi:hypothetical protein